MNVREKNKISKNPQKLFLYLRVDHLARWMVFVWFRPMTFERLQDEVLALVAMVRLWLHYVEQRLFFLFLVLSETLSMQKNRNLKKRNEKKLKIEKQNQTINNKKIVIIKQTNNLNWIYRSTIIALVNNNAVFAADSDSKVTTDSWAPSPPSVLYKKKKY